MNRSRASLAVALAVSFVLLGWLVLRGPNDQPALASQPASQPPTAPESAVELAPARETAPFVVAQPPALPTRDVATPGVDTAPPPAAKTPRTTLYGFVRPAAGRDALHGEPGLSFVDRTGSRQFARAALDGAYSIAGLAPGRHWIEGGSVRDGQVSAQVEIAAADSERRLDLQLELAPEVLVKVVDRAGSPIQGIEIFAVATLQPPGAWFEEVIGSLNNPFGVGHFWQNGYASERLSDVYLGKVVLDVEPPVYVSLLHFMRVVATRRVEPGQFEVEFVLDGDSPLLQPGSVRFRFVDAGTGEPLSRATAMFEGSGARAARAQDGVHLVTKVAPGWYGIVALADGYERAHRRVLVEPGVENDFGDIALERELTLDALVVDAAGAPVATTFELARYDPVARRAIRGPSSYGFRSNGDGKLHIGGLSRELHLLRQQDNDSAWALSARLVDLRAGSISGLRIELVRGAPLVVRPSGASWREVRFKVIDGAGTPLTSSRLWSPAPRAIPLAPGRYEVEVRASEASDPARIPITIGADPVELALP